MDKKKILIASLFAAIMILVPFTVVATDPIRSVRERDPVDDSKLEKASEPDYRLPEYFDITGLKLSRDELANLKEQSNFVSELTLATEDYFGVEIPVFESTLLQNGQEFATVSIIDPGFIQLGEDSLIAVPMGGGSGTSWDGYCALLFSFASIVSAAAVYLAAMCAYTSSIGAPGSQAYCYLAGAYAATAAAMWAQYQDECSGTTSSSTSASVQTIIDTITTGATVEVSEIFDVVQMIEGETCNCGA